jgi:hypothetical protein
MVTFKVQFSLQSHRDVLDDLIYISCAGRICCCCCNCAIYIMVINIDWKQFATLMSDSSGQQAVRQHERCLRGFTVTS